MSIAYASNKRALGVCDRCGFTYKLKELRNLTVNRTRVGIKACPECWEPDQPQLHLGDRPIYDPQALRDPRTDSGEFAQSRSLTVSFQPINMLLTVGSVSVIADVPSVGLFLVTENGNNIITESGDLIVGEEAAP